MDDREQLKEALLRRLNSAAKYKAMRVIASDGAKNLQSTGDILAIMASDPNPKVLSNEPKKRFSKEQKVYLKNCYFSWAVHGKLPRDVVIMAFEMQHKFSDPKIEHRSAKRSAKNLAQYGYLTLSYGDPNDFNLFEEYDIHVFQPVLVAEATMAGVEKGREFIEADGETTDPDELKAYWEDYKAQMKNLLSG